MPKYQQTFEPRGQAQEMTISPKTRDLSMLVDHRKTSFLRYRPSLLVLFVSILITALTFIKMVELEHLRLQNDFEKLSKNIVTLLKDSIENNLGVLSEVGGFYAASKNVERSEFNQFANYIFHRRNDIYMLGWSPRTSQAEIQALNQTAAAEGMTDFTITQYDHRGFTIPVKQRDEYFPVFYVEPYQQNKSIIGLDQSSYALTQNAMRKAVDIGLPVSTIIMSLPQFEKEPPASRGGIQVFAPIYKNNTATNSLEGRRENLAGFVVVAFHIRRMLESVLKNVTSPELEIRIFAEGVRDKNKLIYTYNPQSFDKLQHSWKTTTEINVASQHWTVVCSSTPAFKKNNYRWEALAVFVVGILLGFLLAIYLFSFERNRIQEIMVALSLTDELTKLYNRRGFWLLTDEQLRLALRTKRGFYLLVMDLDQLKKINDTLGHPEGDRAIKRAALLFQNTFRKSDIVARIGGDEFAVIAIETNPLSLPTLLEHLETQLKKNNLLKENFYKLSISTGAAYFDPANPCTLEELIARADKELYAQKKIHRAQNDETSSQP